MDEEQLKAKAKQGRGAAKEQLGKAADRPDVEREGRDQRAAGDAKEAGSKAKQALGKLADAARHARR